MDLQTQIKLGLYDKKSITWIAWEYLRREAKESTLAGARVSASELKKTLWSRAMRFAYAWKQERKADLDWEVFAWYPKGVA